MEFARRLLRRITPRHLFLLISSYFVVAQSAVTGPLTARLLAPAERGGLSFLLTSVILAVSLLDLDLGEAMGARLAAFSRTVLIKSSRPLVVVCSLLSVPATVLVSLVAREVTSESWWLVAVIVVTLLTTPVTALRLGIVLASGNYGRFLLMRASGGLFLIAGLVMLLLRGIRHDVPVVAALYMFTRVVPLLVPAPKWAGTRTGGVPVADEVTNARRILRTDLPSMAFTSVCVSSNARLDQLLLPNVLAFFTLGLYVVGGNYGALVAPLADTIAKLMYRRGASERLALRDVVKPIAAVGLAAAALAAAAPLLVPFIFGRSYSGAVPLAMSMCAVGGLQACTSLVFPVVISHGHSKALTTSSLVALVLTPLCLPLGALLGGPGAVVASLISSCGQLAWLLLAIRRAGSAGAPLTESPPVADPFNGTAQSSQDAVRGGRVAATSPVNEEDT